MKETIKILRKSFCTEALEYPLKSYLRETYSSTLEKKLKLFFEKVKELPDTDEVLYEIKSKVFLINKISESLLIIIDEYLKGRQVGASKEFEKLLSEESVKSKVLELIESVKSHNKDGYRLFRIRKSEENIIERKDIFHIPFSKRHLVANQRYSIAGLPCLYLGSSIYICWLELERPRFSDIYISGFQSNNSINVLNLAYDLEHIIKDFSLGNIDKNQFINKFLLWPLNMACSFQVKYPKAPFHEEYIIPGLLLEWISLESEKIRGLKYFTTKLSSSINSQYCINYVFPPKILERDFEYCPVLTKDFLLTNPLSWDLLTILPPSNVIALGSSITADNLEDALLNNYNYSKFGFVEEQVFSMTFDRVKNIY